jgi:hypothetical protein
LNPIKTLNIGRRQKADEAERNPAKREGKREKAEGVRLLELQ